MAYVSNLAAVRAQMERARDAGLIAAAQVALNRIKRKLAGGFKTGDFTTGDSVNSATRTDPVDENGVRVIRIGTALMHNLFWTLGHVNLFTGTFERNDLWVSEFFSTANEQALAFARTFTRFMDQPRAASEAAD